MFFGIKLSPVSFASSQSFCDVSGTFSYFLLSNVNSFLLPIYSNAA